MTGEQQLVLYANLPAARMRRRIEDGDIRFTSHEQVYGAYLLAYDSESRADRARTRWLEDYVKRECDKAARSKARP